MNITSAQYVENEFNSGTNIAIKAVIDGETLHVPLDPDNRHYAAIFFFKQKAAYEIQAAE